MLEYQKLSQLTLFLSLPDDVQEQASSEQSPTMRSKSPTKASHQSSRLNRVSQTSDETTSSPISFMAKTPQLLEDEDEFFGINEIEMCLCGLWLCVANKGGCVMAFDFSLDKKTKEPQVCVQD